MRRSVVGRLRQHGVQQLVREDGHDRRIKIGHAGKGHGDLPLVQAEDEIAAGERGAEVAPPDDVDDGGAEVRGGHPFLQPLQLALQHDADLLGEHR